MGDWEEVTSVVGDWKRLFVVLLCKEEIRLKVFPITRVATALKRQVRIRSLIS